MANRVTGAEVKEVIKTSLLAADIAPMITAANLLVTAKCSTAGYSTDELKEIERWLSAHFVSIRDPSTALKSKKVGEAEETYQTAKFETKASLETTPYGQQALILDYKGCLTALGRMQATFRAFGVEHEDFE